MIATGFNRCHVSTNEGGSIEEEVYVRNIVDQVDTNGTVFLGLTTGCARCHDHKYDPIRAKDYYQLFAFFNNIDGPAMDGNGAKWAPIVHGADAASKTRRFVPIAPRSPTANRSMSETSAKLVAGGPVKDDGDRQTSRIARPISSGSTTPCREGATPQGDGPWDFVGKPEPPGF